MPCKPGGSRRCCAGAGRAIGPMAAKPSRMLNRAATALLKPALVAQARCLLPLGVHADAVTLLSRLWAGWQLLRV